MTTITAPAITLDDVLRALMETRNTIRENEEIARLRSERNAEEAKKRAETYERELRESRMDFDKRMKELSKQLGGHANRLGEFVQEMVKPAVVRLFQERGLPVHQVLPNMEGKSKDNQPQVEIEVDLVVVNTQVLIAVECKSHLTQEAVDEHLERLTVFKRCFPQFANYIVLGAVAGMVMPKEVSRYAHKKGLFVLAQSGSSIEIRNPSGFDAKEW